MVTELSIERGRLVLPHLVACAKDRQTITYGALGKRIGVHHRALSKPLAYIRDHLCRARSLSLITCIVVRKGVQTPGQSWFVAGGRDILPSEETRVWEDECRKVFDYGGWDDLLQDLGLLSIWH